MVLLSRFLDESFLVQVIFRVVDLIRPSLEAILPSGDIFSHHFVPYLLFNRANYQIAADWRRKDDAKCFAT